MRWADDESWGDRWEMSTFLNAQVLYMGVLKGFHVDIWLGVETFKESKIHH
jgi:hypothetical protein